MSARLVNILELFPIVGIKASVRALGRNETLAYAHPPRRRDQPFGYRILQPGAEGRGAGRYRLKGQVLAISLAVLAPERDQDVGADDEDDQGDDGGNYQRLRVAISIRHLSGQ